MQPEPTYCSTCDNCLRVNPKDPPYRWLCQKFPRLDGFGWVTKDTWDDMPPYAYAKDINHGLCPLWVLKAPGQMRMGEMVEEVQ